MKPLTHKSLPYFGAAIQAVLFSFAGVKYFDIPFFGAVIGLGVGAVVNYSVALASSRINDIAKNRKPLAFLALALLFALSPVIICSTLGWSMATFSWSVACDLSIVLAGAISGKSLLPAETPQKSAERKVKPLKTPQAKQAKTNSARLSFVCRNAGAGCEKAFASQNAANAHGRTCKFKPTIAMPIEITQEIKR